MIEYHIYVEGQLNCIRKSYKSACIIREKFEEEGWNVKVIKWEYSFLGDIGVEV